MCQLHMRRRIIGAAPDDYWYQDEDEAEVHHHEDEDYWYQDEDWYQDGDEDEDEDEAEVHHHEDDDSKHTVRKRTGWNWYHKDTCKTPPDKDTKEITEDVLTQALEETTWLEKLGEVNQSSLQASESA